MNPKTLAMRKIYLSSFIVLNALFAASFPSGNDSTAHAREQKKSFVTITGRVHTMGLFMYMGRVVNHNPAADIFFSTTNAKGWGFSAFKVFDVNDIHSGNNFAFAFIHKTFRIHERLMVAPWLGAGLEQQHKWVDHGSDVMLQLVSNLKLNANFSIEHIALFNNVAFETSHADWTNRFRFIYSQKHVDATGFFWHNNSLIDGRAYTSAGFGIFYNRVPVANRLWLGAGINTLVTLASSNQERVPKNSAVQFTTSLTFK